MARELSEAITDPLVGRSFEDRNGPAWTGGAGEVSDKCEAAGPAGFRTNPKAFKPVLGGNASKGTLYTRRINGHRYYTQSNRSNKDGACKMRSVIADPSRRSLCAAAIGEPHPPAKSPTVVDGP